ncbi:hypothetical protein OSB04_015868 [Centaurea solstitialis]|uniref:F-box domain-containing protein n=1 Tax=Centaurea solstitialis TaxID=347529 RepID=A0AA38T7M4_9ASTR|nr:hypothetical protein OSB04_015868 [Centaurea solstitialis]
MIVEDEGDMINWIDEEVDNSRQIFQGSTHEFQEYFQRNSEIRSNEVHHQLCADLVEHIWSNRDYDGNDVARKNMASEVLRGSTTVLAVIYHVKSLDLSSQEIRTIIGPSMEDLPTELTTDILSRLPVNTIIHCKLVCSKWRNIVSDRLFATLHLSRSPTGLIINHNPLMYRSDYCFPRNYPGTLKWVEIEDKVDHHHLNYDCLFNLDLNLAPILQNARMCQVGSVNGLVCLLQCGHKVDNTYICNPVTREYMILPRQRSPTEDGYLRFVYGFGVSSLTGEYKVVRAFQTKTVVRNGDNPTAQPSVLEAEIYTLGIGQWRSLGPVPVTYRLNIFEKFHGLFLNNHCHWIVRDFEDAHEKIATFDFDKETFQLFPYPPPESVKGLSKGLAILKGCLCKLETYVSELTIWLMKEYGIKNSWHKELVIRREIYIDLEWPLYKVIHLIAGLKDGSILIVFENKICVFDPRSEMLAMSGYKGLESPNFLSFDQCTILGEGREPDGDFWSNWKGREHQLSIAKCWPMIVGVSNGRVEIATLERNPVEIDFWGSGGASRREAWELAPRGCAGRLRAAKPEASRTRS